MKVSLAAHWGLYAGALERFVSDRRERAELLSAVAAACEASAEVRATKAAAVCEGLGFLQGKRNALAATCGAGAR